VEYYDVIIVGGGPAGSACATELVRAGANVVVLDRETFPRTKLCAGWITPQVVDDLAIDIDDYPYRFNTFDDIVVHIKGLSFELATPQHSIRRFEFDRFLLDRSGAKVRQHHVRTISRSSPDYAIDDAYACRHLIGAGGTRCPVYRSFFRDANPRAKELQAVAYEHEFAYEWTDSRCHLWFFDKGLPGYAWYVPKADGYLNCGVGGMAEKLNARGDSIKAHWDHHITQLRRTGYLGAAELDAKGYSYYLRGGVDVVRVDNAFIIGDAAGLATRDLCEGIGPAVSSGQRAARAIVDGTEFSLDSISGYSSSYRLVRGLLEYMFINRPTPSRRPDKIRTSNGGAGQ